MISFTKSFLTNLSCMWISGVKCSYDNIIRISNIFNYKWIAITIDSIKEKSLLMTSIKTQGLEYLVKQHENDYAEISAVIPFALFDDILKRAICEYPENIFVLFLLDPTSWNIHTQCSFAELVATGIVNAYISISLDENAILISVNKRFHSPQEIYRKIKALRFD